MLGYFSILFDLYYKITLVIVMKDKIYYRKLRELREDHDYTQTYVAKILGLSQRGYSHYEVGHYDLTATLLIKLSKLYNVSIDYILENKRKDN